MDSSSAPQILFDLIGRIIATEDLDAVTSWARQPQQLSQMAPAQMSPQAARSCATMLARSIWNQTPLPGNRFRPQPLPKPKRNERCPCGSGTKYKNCCADIPLPEMPTDVIWFIVLATLDPEQLQQALAAHAVPAQALTGLADGYLQEGSYNQARELLEPLFAGDLNKLSEQHEAALDTLCDVYNAQGLGAKKRAFLDRLISDGPKSIRVPAWQRLASVYMDDGDNKSAWQAFQQAQRADPKHPALPLLELTLLGGENRLDEAAERARFWRRKLQRDDSEHPEFLDFLDAVADDARAALSPMIGAILPPAGKRLFELLQDGLAAAQARPLPTYTIVAWRDDDDDDDIIDIEDIPILDDRQLSLDLPEVPETSDTTEQPPLRYLQPPPSISLLDDDWREDYPLDKPFSTQPLPFGDDDPFDPQCAGEWMAWLQDEPETLDSINIMDDLATLLCLHMRSDDDAANCYEPLLERAVAILDQTLARTDNADEVELPWPLADNRPMLRLLFRYIVWLNDQGDTATARPRIQQYLRLNPDDNHGVRQQLMDDLLRAGQDQDALALAARYPGDILVNISFGTVLAHYRQGDKSAARTALHAATELNSHVVPMLQQDNLPQPEMSEFGVAVGSEDEAWLYRETMRDVWLEVDGLLEWAQETLA